MKYIKYFEKRENRIFIDILIEYKRGDRDNAIFRLKELLDKNEISPSDRISRINGVVFGDCKNVRTILDNIDVDTANWTLLMIASYSGELLDMIDILMKYADKSLLEEKDQDLTALMLASLNERIESIEKLIDLGADVFYKKDDKDFFDMADIRIKNEILKVVSSKENIAYFADMKKYNL